MATVKLNVLQLRNLINEVLTESRPVADVRVKKHYASITELPKHVTEHMSDDVAPEDVEAATDIIAFTIPGYGPSKRYGLVVGDQLVWFWDEDDGWQQL